MGRVKPPDVMVLHTTNDVPDELRGEAFRIHRAQQT